MLIETSCAATLVPAGVIVPKGMVATPVVTVVEVPLPPSTAVPEATEAIEKVKLGSTVALAAIEVEVRVAKATGVGPSMTVEPESE